MLKIIIVDDEKIIRESICSMIPEQELQLHCMGSCANALEALELMTDEMPDILMTDIKMPVMNGLALIAKAKQLYPALVCIVLSGYAEFPLAQEAIKQGVRDYLLKPCSREDVQNVLAACCKEIRANALYAGNSYSQRKQRVEELEKEIYILKKQGGQGLSVKAIQGILQPYGDASLLQEVLVKIAAQYMPSQELRTALSQLSCTGNDRESLLEYALLLLTELPLDEERETFVDQMKQYIEENYCNPSLTLQYLSESVVHRNAKYIGKIFLRETGMRFSEYLMQVRMENAKILLRSAGVPKIGIIAEQVGFTEHVQYFYSVFKKHTGLTPREYQEQAMQ